jgi:hypothetical protein
MGKNHVYYYGTFKIYRQHLFPTLSLRKLSGAFGLTASKLWYPHYSNTTENLDYVGQIPALKYYGVEEMGVSERS